MLTEIHQTCFRKHKSLLCCLYRTLQPAVCSQLRETFCACWCVACGGQAPHQLHTAARCVQPVVCSQPRLPSCVHRTLRVSDVRSRLYRRLRIFRDLQLVGWRASVGSAFNYAVRVSAPGFFGVCSPAGFRFVCPFRLAVVVRLGWFGACVRSFSWRVFAVGWLLGFCVGCGLLFSCFSFCVLLLV